MHFNSVLALQTLKYLQIYTNCPFKKKGTPAEREAAVEARRQAILAEKQNKARKYINKVESYAQKKHEMVAQAEDNEGGKENDFSEKVDDVQE